MRFPKVNTSAFTTNADWAYRNDVTMKDILGLGILMTLTMWYLYWIKI